MNPSKFESFEQQMEIEREKLIWGVKSTFVHLIKKNEREGALKALLSELLKNIKEGRCFKMNYKRHIISAAITFIAAFLVTIAPEVGNLTVDSATSSAVWGLVFVGFRAGVKALVELLTHPKV
jgi:hypothetical protein